MFRRFSIVFVMVTLLIVGVRGSVLAQTEDEILTINQVMLEAFNAHNWEKWMSYMTDDVVHEYVPVPTPVTGKEENRAFMTSVSESFPDCHSDHQRILVSGNILVLEWIFTGTLKGQWMGMGPTGKGGPIPHLTIFEFKENKVKRLTTYFDVVTFMVQTGLMPVSTLPPLKPSFTLPASESTGLAPLEADAEFRSRWNTHDLPNWAKMIHPNADILVAPFGVPIGRDEVVAMSEAYFLSASDLRVDIVRQVDLGDGWILNEAVYKGTADGPLFGMPATNVYTETRAAYVGRYDADGLTTYHHLYYDNMGTLVSRGVIPGPTTVLPTTWGQIKSQFRE